MHLPKLTHKLAGFLGSNCFFRLTLAWFGIQAGWLASSALYPMAFDEKFHFDLINLYAERWHPFWTATPAGSSVFGAVTRDPSYMYHYLLSFPFRLVELVIGSPTGQVIILRFVNIAMFVFGVWLFSKLLRRSGLSAAASNVVLAIFCALPICSLLASQVNYDNLIFLLTPACLLYLQKIITTLKAKGILETKSVLKLALLAMFAALVKYAFLPVILAMGIGLMYYYVRFARHSWKMRFRQHRKDIAVISPRIRVFMLGLFIVLFGLCIERYGVNVVRYHTPTPECDQVLSVEDCLNFSPWRRNYYTRQSKLRGQLEKYNMNITSYAKDEWLDTSTFHLFFALDGPRAGYEVGNPIPILQNTALKLACIGGVLFIVGFWRIRKRYSIGIFLFIAGVYVFVLFVQNYLEFKHLGYPFGIQGRYLVPFLPIAGSAVIGGYNYALKRIPSVKPWLASAVILLFTTQGGGAATYIIRSNSAWDWPNKSVIRANDRARQIVKAITIGE